MRRLLAIAVLATALLATACTASTEKPSGGSTTKTPASRTPGSTAADNPDTKAACDAADAAITDGMTKFLTEYSNGLAAVAAGDKPKEDIAEKAMKAASDDLATKLRAEAGRTSSADLKSALEATAKAYQDIGSDIQKIDQARLETAGNQIRDICG